METESEVMSCVPRKYLEGLHSVINSLRRRLGEYDWEGGDEDAGQTDGSSS